ncbi:hypothetical protein HPT29_021260 [Microvirga terrae]|uniref:Uncharacterized protein n=1 Tax=Microvirga terrae TaxID=2740529 RepID=A0ABY5RSN6_9HYPH|nr:MULTISPECIES: hypothetical protein [Microvirga]UVF18969.1 hypothetical protein HPT29_021260 [Microvirga terrae]
MSRHDEDFTAGFTPPFGAGACSLLARWVIVDCHPKALDTTKDR